MGIFPLRQYTATVRATKFGVHSRGEILAGTNTPRSPSTAATRARMASASAKGLLRGIVLPDGPSL
jgi:hypothetical protein